ncbi:hypothetical protein B0H13DRAFT_1894830 [Mycena leptocephala]|nr:hypothetical protein B0H13DRAFT_1894830 [Mycena leptocephala]
MLGTVAADVPVYALSAISARAGKFLLILGSPGYVTDGSPENRVRFATETVKVLVEVWASDVMVKLRPAGVKNDVGMRLQETINFAMMPGPSSWYRLRFQDSPR